MFICINSSAQFTHSGRGMYVNKFFKLSVNSTGAIIPDINRSILSFTDKEDSLLNYCKENHFTYLVLYDLYYVFGNPLYESYLCAFIEKAKTQYCIEKIGVASSCSAMFDDVAQIIPTPALFLPNNYDAGFQNKMNIIQRSLPLSDSLFYVSEVVKLGMRASIFNTSCSYKFDVLVSEYEFWNTTTDDCVGDNPTKDQKYVRYQELIDYMDAIRDDYNSTNTHQLFVETYLGYLNQNTIYSHQSIADWIDGSYNGKRRADRINPHYYASDATKLYSRTTTGWNNSGYYLTRFLDFCQGSTVNQTNLHPIFSSEYTYWGAGSTFLGQWFTQNINNNIFSAEKYFYNDWRDDAQNFNPTTVGDSALGTILQPGGVQWFASQYLLGHVDNPLLYTSNSPVCTNNGTNGSFQFQYQGPIEQGLSFKFYLTDAGSSVIRCGSDTSQFWPAYNPVTQSSIDLNAALGTCSLPIGNYDAHLILEFISSCSSCNLPCSVYTVPIQTVSVGSSGSIVALTPTTVCQGNAVFLQANSTEGGSTTYSWYDGTNPISGATSASYAVVPTATGTHNYSCKITSFVTGCSANRSNIIPVTINTHPSASIAVQSSSACSIVLKATPNSSTYKWQNGSVSSTFTANSGGSYSVAVTKNGCTSIAAYTVTKININKVSQTNACGNSASGSLTVNLYWGQSPYTLSWSGPVSGSIPGLPAGITTINNLSAGNYIVTLADANGCSRSLYPNPAIQSDTLFRWFFDSDGDGYGDIANYLNSCSKPPGFIKDSSDCNDFNFDSHPGAPELCNNEDDNCDGTVNEGCSFPLMLTLKLYIQGYYIATDSMIAVVDSVANPLLCDTIIVELHSPSSPYQQVYSSKSTINILGEGNFDFPSVYFSSYYFIVVKHRNAIETWSKDSVLFNAFTYNYDFTDAVDKAYGNNLADLGDGNFAIFSGDVSDGSLLHLQDGQINDADFLEVINAVHSFTNGYSVFDLTGNGMVESADFSILENNFSLLISSQRP